MLAIGGTLASVLAISLIREFHWLIPTVIVYAFFAAPTMPLVDDTVVTMLGERKDQYGKQRLWGAVGWGVAAPIAGALIDQSGLQWAFFCYLILMSGGLLVATRLPVSQASIGARFWQGLRLLVTNRQWIIFLVTVLVGFLGLSMVNSFLFLYLRDLGASNKLMGFSLTVATISELPVWFYSDRLLDRFGTRGVLGISLLAQCTQAFAFAAIRTPWLALPVQLLHGLGFSAMWAAGVSYANEIAPAGMRATALGLFAGVAMGLRSALGAFIGGVLYENAGAVTMFQVGGTSALLGLIFFVLASARRD